ncbi:hypothetical protein [Luteolibacter luteus]|uniref:PpiC domain-containing protein n=1 Tax=Luteolibacter luteus TaxID=2728835 RepID=A0A858RP01_9BACT|nr:hypothetical protein [Luteolibacter luteus]QJE97663.1 hypothetical protein HHL09_18385 [Luteolibacter luteus]
MLMTLMVMLALSLLTLSSTSISTSGRNTDLAIARSNARLALSMAIAQLQRSTGPDQRITTTADQLSGSDPDSSSSAEERRHWTGVYKSWAAGVTNRPGPDFMTWLVSGDPDTVERPELAQGSGGDSIELVGKGTLGDARDGKVEVPALRVQDQNGGSARIAWWTGDQGTKAALATPPVPENQSVASVRGSLQGAPRNAVEFAEADQQRPFQDLELSDARIPKVTGWNQAAFLASDKDAPRALFHDLAPFSTGLMTNVRAGGFRKDFSMYLEKSASQAPSAPLYRVGNQAGINESELWLYYNLHKELKTRGRFTYTTGGTMSSSAPYFQIEGTMAAALADAEYFYKQPQIVSYQTVVSFQVRSANRLSVVIDPIVTYWNPLDVPVVMTPAFNSIKYWQLPYDMKISVGGRTYMTSMRKATGSRSGTDDGAYQYLTLVAGKVQPIVMKPGEVMMISQGPGTTTQPMTSSLNYVDGRAGWNFGGGYAFELVTGTDASGNKQYITVTGAETLSYEINPNSEISGGSQQWSVNHHETYYKEDRKERGESIGIGGVFVDYIFAPPYKESSPKPPTSRMRASGHPAVFAKIKPADTRPLSGSQLAEKQPVMIYSYNAKTENASDRGGRVFSRFNPKAMAVDFSDLSAAEQDVMPFEVQIQPLNSWRNRSLEVSTNGNGYFGGGMNAEFGTSFISTHSVPREAIVSMGAFQHAFANGFAVNAPPDGYAITNVRFPMLPHVSHPIGNSLAPSVIPAGSTQSNLGSRPMADHSYLANQALWDDWYLSGMAPQTSTNFSPRRAQKQVAEDFLNGTTPLPVTRYIADLGGRETSDLMSELFSGTNPTTGSTQLTATLLRVDGLFNVNSTSVEAWKAVLGSLKGRPIVVRDASGGESVKTDHDDGVPVSGLFAPQDVLASGQGNVDVKEPNQWVGRRTLTGEDIDSLAKAIVREVRKRGPFLSLADFVNRRVGSNKELARAGAIQAALDSKEVSVNAAYNSGDRAVSGTAGTFAFPEAETGPKSYGIPGIVKQGDILTPIAPILSVRSDSFIIRSYGESVDKDGKVLARAWCEAVVERDKNFVDPSEKVETAIANLRSEANKTFGRRYQVASFRWLHPDEV